MNDYEYRRKTHPEYYKRSWPLTITSALLAAFVFIGIIASWRYLGHDPYIIGLVIVPAVIVFLLLTILAWNGRKQAVKEGYADILAFIFWWRP